MDTQHLRELNLSPHVRFRDATALAGWLSSLPGIASSVLGASREGRPVFGYTLGRGPEHISVVAGSHADEPAGPMTAQALPGILAEAFPNVLQRFTFHVLPQINPDGAARNAAWFADPPAFAAYVEQAARELPGDDVEFGFGGPDPRPECRAAMTFLEAGAPYTAHFSLHGMAYAEGAWFLLCREWAQRGQPLMDRLTGFCARLGFPLHDIDRKGEKGFSRLGPGFSTTPTAPAMRAYFQRQNDAETAAKFQPSSMEYVSSLGGNPLCMVSEAPLFLIQAGASPPDDPVLFRFRDALREATDADAVRAVAARYQVAPVPFEQQMRLQLAMLLLALQSAG